MMQRVCHAQNPQEERTVKELKLSVSGSQRMKKERTTTLLMIRQALAISFKVTGSMRAQLYCISPGSCEIKYGTVVPSYHQGICYETPRGCLKLRIIPNSIYTMFFLHMHIYDKLEFIN